MSQKIETLETLGWFPQAESDSPISPARRGKRGIPPKTEKRELPAVEIFYPAPPSMPAEGSSEPGEAMESAQPAPASPRLSSPRPTPSRINKPPPAGAQAHGGGDAARAKPHKAGQSLCIFFSTHPNQYVDDGGASEIRPPPPCLPSRDAHGIRLPGQEPGTIPPLPPPAPARGAT